MAPRMLELLGKSLEAKLVVQKMRGGQGRSLGVRRRKPEKEIVVNELVRFVLRIPRENLPYKKVGGPA